METAFTKFLRSISGKFSRVSFFIYPNFYQNHANQNKQFRGAYDRNARKFSYKGQKASQPTSKITNIEQWTTAFTTYMSVMTRQFPGRAQELLNCMSLIRHAAQTHRGLGWCIYDHKFDVKLLSIPVLIGL